MVKPSDSSVPKTTEGVKNACQNSLPGCRIVMLQRTYPFKSTPREARRNAFDEAQARGLEATAEADNFSWRTIGPTPRAPLISTAIGAR